MKLLGQHHQTFEAPSEADLERQLTLWREHFGTELAELRAEPEGRLVTSDGCCGRQTVRVRPSWTPNCTFDPERLEVSFATVTAGDPPRCVAHATAFVRERP